VSVNVAAGLEPPPQELRTMARVAIASVELPEIVLFEFALMSETVVLQARLQSSVRR